MKANTVEFETKATIFCAGCAQKTRCLMRLRIAGLGTRQREPRNAQVELGDVPWLMPPGWGEKNGAVYCGSCMKGDEDAEIIVDFDLPGDGLCGDGGDIDAAE